MHLQTRDRFATPYSRTKIHRSAIDRIVLPWTGLDDDDMLNLLRSASVKRRVLVCYLVHEHLDTRVEPRGDRIV